MSKVRIVTNGTACAPVVEIDGVNVASAVSTLEILMEPGEVARVRLTIPTGLDLELDAEVTKLIDALSEPDPDPAVKRSIPSGPHGPWALRSATQ